MAVDTRNKRASCLGFAKPPFAVWPNPDGSLANQADRQHVAYSYPGLLATVITAVVPPITDATLDFDFAALYPLEFDSPINRTLDFDYAPLYTLRL